MEEKSNAAKTTLIIALVIAVVFLVFGVAAQETFEDWMARSFAWMTENLGWSFILGASLFLGVVIFLLVSPIGKIKLGKDDVPAQKGKSV